MKLFLMAALPWVSVGLALALTAVKCSPEKQGIQNTYLLECLCVGVCLGVIWGGDGMCYGMLLGTVLGGLIPKETQNEQV